LCRRVVIVQRRDARTLIAIKREVGYASTLQYLRAEAPAVVEQQFVEIRTSDLIAVADTEIGVVGKPERRYRVVRIGYELGTGLVDANAMNGVADSKPVKQWQIQRKQRFPDVEARKTLFFQNDDMFVLLRKQRSNGRAGGTTADNKHIAFTRVRHRRCH